MPGTAASAPSVQGLHAGLPLHCTSEASAQVVVARLLLLLLLLLCFGLIVQELRIACSLAQQEREGGVSAFVSPMAQVGPVQLNPSLSQPLLRFLQRL